MDILGIVIGVAAADAANLGIFNRRMWTDQITAIQKAPPQWRYMGALLAYILLVAGIKFFVVDPVRQDRTKSLWLHAVLFGLVVYGVFDFTNLAIFNDYTWTTALTDLAWGIANTCLAVYLAVALSP